MRFPIIPIALVFGALVAGCGGASQAASHPETNANPPLRKYWTMLNSNSDQNLPPSPQNMPGGGRNSDPTRFKGKP